MSTTHRKGVAVATKHKPINEQVIVITGASSGIGLATAEAAAARGAKVVLAARSQDALRDIAGRLGPDCVAVACDVSEREQVERVAQTALERFGRIDTWVNNAGVSIYGRLDEVREEDNRRLFDTNFWGVCNGSLAALPHLKRSGGALINVGSEVSEAVIPLQGMYAASKHAVKGFTDALRVEVEEIDEAPVSITLIQPTAVDTPYPQHAKNYMDREPKLPTPQIEPEKVADAILHAAEHPTRAARVGAMAKVNTMVAKMAPAMGDKLAAKQKDRQQYAEPPRDREGALYKPSQATTVVARTHGVGGLEE
jgi:short-subunit dehydrogenase